MAVAILNLGQLNIGLALGLASTMIPGLKATSKEAVGEHTLAWIGNATGTYCTTDS